MLSQVPGFIVGIVTGLIASFVAAWVLDRGRKRAQVRQVTASITLTWAPVPGQPNSKVMTGGYLTVKNNSDWPVREVIVLEPPWLNAFHIPYLGPGREHVEPIPYEVLMANHSIDPPVTLQVTDVRGRVYQWRPATNELFDPRWIPLYSRPAQWLSRRLSVGWQHRFNKLMMKLPDRALIGVWGYHPATGERRSKNPKGRPLI